MNASKHRTLDKLKKDSLLKFRHILKHYFSFAMWKHALNFKPANASLPYHFPQMNFLPICRNSSGFVEENSLKAQCEVSHLKWFKVLNYFNYKYFNFQFQIIGI